jgi:hypothetical protein
MPRPVSSTYADPADLIWLGAASALGLCIQRSAEVYASWDGAGTLTLASAEHLDPDDCLAQMIFHEICHLLVAGEDARSKPDWGVDNTSARDLVCEYATNRLQAALAGAYGLRQFMGVTTMWRSYYDDLPHDPLMPASDPAAGLARQGLNLAHNDPYRTVLHGALTATATVAEAVRETAPRGSLWQTVQGLHPAGSRLHADSTLACDTCAWRCSTAKGKMSCRRSLPGNFTVDYRLVKPKSSTGISVLEPGQQACEHFEPVLVEDDCRSCGACCHRGFDVVEVKARESFSRLHPALVEIRADGRRVVPRPNGACVALTGDGSNTAPYRCNHYEDRPRSCRDFALGGDACLVARQRVGVHKSV